MFPSQNLCVFAYSQEQSNTAADYPIILFGLQNTGINERERHFLRYFLENVAITVVTVSYTLLVFSQCY